jgi:hypothetical protein
MYSSIVYSLILGTTIFSEVLLDSQFYPKSLSKYLDFAELLLVCLMSLSLFLVTLGEGGRRLWPSLQALHSLDRALNRGTSEVTYNPWFILSRNVLCSSVAFFQLVFQVVRN